jgi:UDP-N-acetylglucosamine 2-epimerase (non-hydrolysing)
MRLVNVVGARPDLVKMAPLMRAMRRSGLTPILVHTGQLDAPTAPAGFDDLEMPAPDFDLGVASGSPASQTADIMRRLERVLDSLRPDLVLVVGDLNSTLAAALTAVKLHIQLVHLEAGLRCGDRTMSAEVNRVLTDAMSDVLFVTEASGRDHLLREGMPAERVHFVGNVMIDALQSCRGTWGQSSILRRLGLADDDPYAVLTLHCPSNVDDPLTLMNFLDAFEEVARHVPIVFSLHPRVKQHLLRQGYLCRTLRGAAEPLHRKGIVYVDPIPYLDFIALMNRARLVLTDAGRVQDETTFLGVPCLTLRESTERPATVTHGTNRIIGTDPGRIVDAAFGALHARFPRTGRPPLWDGRSAERIVSILAGASVAEAAA